MLILPFELPEESKRGPVVLVIILEPMQIKKLMDAQPIELRPDRFATYIRTSRRLNELEIVIAYEEDHDKLAEFQKTNDIKGLMVWLDRGRTVATIELPKV